MVQTNKILTVSYGTFSCTLEGFDESFETMKAIAEYFRDLAADDRYFGAEPPTPDVEMLARIAEKEISRRVEARFENDGIVLRPSLAAATDADTAGDPDAQPETEAKAEAVTPQPVETPEDVPSETPDEAVAETTEAEAETTEAEAQDAELEAASDALSEPVAEISDDTAEADEADSMADAPALADLSDAAPQEDATAEDHSETLTDAEAAPARDDMPADTAEVAQDAAPAAPMVQAEAPQVYAPGEDPAIKAASPSKVPESIAEKLARIRAVVSSAASAVTSHDSKPEAPQQPVEEAVVDAPVAETTAEDTSDITATEDRAEDTTTEDTLVSDIMSTLSSGAADDTLTTAEPSDDEVAETVATEEALVDMGQDYTVQQVETPVMHDATEAVDSIAATISEDDATDFAEMHTAETGDDMAEAGAAEDDAAEADAADAVYSDNFADMAGAADLEEATEAFDLTEDMAITEEAEDNVASDQADAPVSDIQADAPETADLADAPEQDETPEALDLSDMVATDEQADTAEDTAQDGPIAPRRVAPRRAVRVVKVKRRSAQTDAPGAPLMADTGDSTLAPEDEADLMRELAELEADFTPAKQAPEAIKEEAAAEAPLVEDTAQDISDVVDDTARTIRAMARRERRDSFAEDEGDVSRLLAETDEQLQEPEGRSRRNAIAHLRAAVAATRADRGGDAKPAGTRDRGEAYRDDLAQAVRPRRSTVETPQERPRIAPLKLVAEQRVDLPETEEAAPRAETAAQAVRPRRVSMPVERDEGPEAGGFATFAEEVGASRLPELLEAAAAYMSFVEGRDQFSRPQLMTKVRQIERGDSSREDRLRSFGQLLRDGKIEKVQGGRFTASDSIRFRPDDRAAG